MKDEIVAGLKNALERKEPLEKAMQSFINAGYNASEVQEAARSFQNSAAMPIVSSVLPSRKDFPPAPSITSSSDSETSLFSPQSTQPALFAPRPSSPFGIPTPSVSQPDTMPQQQVTQQVQQVVPKKKGVGKGIIITLVIVLVLVLGLLGASLVFKQKIASLLG